MAEYNITFSFLSQNTDFLLLQGSDCELCWRPLKVTTRRYGNVLGTSEGMQREVSPGTKAAQKINDLGSRVQSRKQ